MVPVMGADGLVSEGSMINALDALAAQHILGKRRIDAVSMSFGYYAETEDADKTASLFSSLKNLADHGVTLVAGAGNDATDRPMYPAAFTSIERLISVGARNPNGSVALFSNAGAWVDTYWVGAQVISTAPRTFQGAGEPTARTRWEGRDRESLDLDDFSDRRVPAVARDKTWSPAGFATWSGTSFAAPAFLGFCLQQHLEAVQQAGELSEVAQDVAEQYRS
jgi:subtilisin family serine protease